MKGKRHDESENYHRGVSKGGAGGAIAPPLFGKIEGAAGGGATPHYYLYYYLPPHFKKLLTPLFMEKNLEKYFQQTENIYLQKKNI